MSLSTLFGKQRPREVDQPAIRAAIAKANEAIDLATKRIEYDDRKIDEYKKLAVAELRAGRKPRALAALRNKKRFERDQDKYAACAGVLLEQKLALEGCALDNIVVDALRSASTAMQRASVAAPIADIERLMESLETHMQHANDVSAEMARPVGAVPLDDDDLERELDELVASDPVLSAAATPRPAGATGTSTPARALAQQVAASLAPQGRSALAYAAPPERSEPVLVAAAVSAPAQHRRTRSLSDGHAPELPDAPAHAMAGGERRQVVRMDYA